MLTVDQLLYNRTITPEAVGFLRAVVQADMNVLLVSGDDTAMPDLLNMLAGFIRREHRVISIERYPELSLPLQMQHTCLTTPQAQVSATLQTVTRIKPEYIVVNDIPTEACATLLDTAASRETGMLVSLRADLNRYGIGALEQAYGASTSAVATARAQIVQSFDLLVTSQRHGFGGRPVKNIVEFEDFHNGEIVYRSIFDFKSLSRFNGDLTPTGHHPTFVDRLDDIDAILPRKRRTLGNNTMQTKPVTPHFQRKPL
ncbi:MAG: hypothetical protein AAFU54_14590 [Chloroflexota bacterium]